MRMAALCLLAVATWAQLVPAVAQDAPHHQQAREIYERLISFRTAAGQGQVPVMARYIEETLQAGGIPPGDMVTLPHGESVGLLVRVPGTDAAARPILFSGHMDVVDARPEDWERAPFTLVEEDGYFFGRGTGDNKAGIAAMVSTLLRMAADAHRPGRTLLFAFIGDEETGMETTRLVAAHEWVRDAEYAINTDAGGGMVAEDGRPLMYLVQGAEKTYVTFRLSARNPGGHSSRPRLDNAIYDLAEALLRIRGYEFPVTSNALTRAMLGTLGRVLPGDAGPLLVRFAEDPNDAEAAAALRSDPYLAAELATTCVATMVEAGHAENALPQRAEALVNCRVFPGTSVADVHGTLVGVVANPDLSLEVTNEPIESPVSEPREDVMAAIARSIHARYPGLPITPYMESGGTDGLVYRNAGIPTWASSGIFMKDSDMFFHGLNERIPVAAFYEALDHIHSLAVELGGL